MEQLNSPYIGVTGFVNRNEVRSTLNSFPDYSNRLLMVGVVATWKSMREIPMKPRWKQQTPDPSQIKDIFIWDKKTVNLIHYSSEQGEESSLLKDMFDLQTLAYRRFDGFQINMAWPDVRSLADYRNMVGFGPRIVLQIGAQAVELAGNTPTGVASVLYHYSRFINDILIDPSGGQGKPFDTEKTRQYLSAIADRGWNIGLGVAGGLGPDSLHLVEPLIDQFPDLSMDAQGKLRNSNNELDLESVARYTAKADQLFKQS